MLYSQLHPTDGDYSKINEIIKASEDNFAHLKSIDKIQAEKGEKLLWRYFKKPVADGTAFYQVVRTTKKTATVMICTGICLGEYQDSMLGQSATLPIDMVQKMVSSRIALDKLFSK